MYGDRADCNAILGLVVVQLRSLSAERVLLLVPVVASTEQQPRLGLGFLSARLAPEAAGLAGLFPARVRPGTATATQDAVPVQERRRRILRRRCRVRLGGMGVVMVVMVVMLLVRLFLRGRGRLALFRALSHANASVTLFVVQVSTDSRSSSPSVHRHPHRRVACPMAPPRSSSCLREPSSPTLAAAPALPL